MKKFFGCNFMLGSFKAKYDDWIKTFITANQSPSNKQYEIFSVKLHFTGSGYWNCVKHNDQWPIIMF